MDFGIAHRTVVITGASRGLGRQLAQTFAHGGARLGLFARDDLALKELAATLPTEALPVACDVRDPAGFARGLAEVADRLHGIDSVIANAGVFPNPHRAHKLELEKWRETLETNLTGSFLTASSAHSYLAASGHGRLVLTSSVMARVPHRGISAYAASKAGIEGLTRALAVDWATERICVNAIAVGFFDAGLGETVVKSDRLRSYVLSRTPLDRFGAIDDLTAAAAFLAGDASGFVTGQVLSVDGGYATA